MGQLKLPGLLGAGECQEMPCRLGTTELACGIRCRLWLQKPIAVAKATRSSQSHLQLQKPLWLQKPLVAAKPLAATKATCGCKSHLQLKSHLWLQKPLAAAKATCGCKSHLRLQKSLAADKTTRNNQSRLCGVRPWPARVGRRKTCVKPPRASCAMQLGIQAIAFHAPRVR